MIINNYLIENKYLLFIEFTNVVHIMVHHIQVEKPIQVQHILVHHKEVEKPIQLHILVVVDILVEHQQLVHSFVDLKFFQLHFLFNTKFMSNYISTSIEVHSIYDACLILSTVGLYPYLWVIIWHISLTKGWNSL